jgi:hypothetical protein
LKVTHQLEKFTRRFIDAVKSHYGTCGVSAESSPDLRSLFL